MRNQSLSDLRDQSIGSSGNTLLFNPKINQKSKELVRNDTVGNLLYKAALDQRKKSLDKELERHKSAS
jgi:hypothetical protein